MQQTGRSSILVMVVMLIIFSLLLTALFTYTARKREELRCAKCLNQLKCAAQSLVIYSDSYDGQLPSSYFVSRSKRWNAKDSAFFCTGANWRGNQVTAAGPCKTWPDFLSHNHCLCPPFCGYENWSNPQKMHVSYYYKLANDKAWYAGRKRMGDYGFEADQIAF